MATRTMDGSVARARLRSPRDGRRFYLSCLILLLVSAVALTTIVPSWIAASGQRPGLEDRGNAVATPVSGPGGSASNSIYPGHAGAARPTATFPAFAARGGGLYANGEADGR